MMPRINAIKKISFIDTQRSWLNYSGVLLWGGALPFLAYYLLSQIAYFPGGIGGVEVFLRPRFYGGQNDLVSGVFKQWKELFIVFPLLSVLLYSVLWVIRKRYHSFKVFLIVIYAASLTAELSFVLLTPNGINHFARQTISVNNGIWGSLGHISGFASTNNLSLLETMRYIFADLGGNRCGYTIPGTTHPPGMFIIGGLIYELSRKIFFFLDPAAGWAITVTMLNTFIIVMIALITKEIFSKKTAMLISLFIITAPSTLMHFCAVFDGIGSLSVAIAIYYLIKALKYVSEPCVSVKRLFIWGISVGFCFVVGLSITYGHAIPVIALSLCFFLLCDKSAARRFFSFLSGMVFVAAVYFIFEYLVSGGASNWVKRALYITKEVEKGLFWRPYAISQVANFTVMAIMGGLLFFPAVLHIFIYLWHSVRRSIQRSFYIKNKKELLRFFLITSTAVMLIFLLFQKIVRLEVERTWHWLFVPVWAISGVFIIYLRVLNRKLSPPKSGDVIYITLLALQFIVTVVLAMGIQDYY